MADKNLEDRCSDSFPEKGVILCRTRLDCPYKSKRLVMRGKTNLGYNKTYSGVSLPQCTIRGHLNDDVKEVLAEKLRDKAQDYVNQRKAMLAINTFVKAGKLHAVSIHEESLLDIIGGSLNDFKIDTLLSRFGMMGGSILEYLRIAKEPCIEVTITKYTQKYLEKAKIDVKAGEKQIYSGKEYLELCKAIAKENAMYSDTDLDYKDWENRFRIAVELLDNYDKKN